MGYQDIYELQRLSGAKAKQAFMETKKDDVWFQTFLYYAVNPLITYHLSEKTLRKFVQEHKINGGIPQPHSFDNIFDCCEFLERLRGMDTATLFRVQEFLCEKCEEDERELYIKLLAKTLRLGVTGKSVNKVFDALIPEWEVQQAFPFEKYPIESGTTFWLTQKLNGVRATFYNGELIARSGQPFDGLDHIIKELRYAYERGLVLDGELTLLDKQGMSDNEAFRTATGIINSNAESKREICYTIFDVIDISGFENDNSQVPYTYRRLALDKLDREMCARANYVSVLPVLYTGTGQKYIWTLLNQMVSEDKEGLMLNTDVPYRRTRHKGILKVKKFSTMDLPIVRCDPGEGRLSNTLGSIVVDFNGNEVSVGSGYSDDERGKIWESRDDLVGTICEVKYKEVSVDYATGKQSLQFPVFVCLRHDKFDRSEF